MDDRSRSSSTKNSKTARPAKHERVIQPSEKFLQEIKAGPRRLDPRLLEEPVPQVPITTPTPPPVAKVEAKKAPKTPRVTKIKKIVKPKSKKEVAIPPSPKPIFAPVIQSSSSEITQRYSPVGRQSLPLSVFLGVGFLTFGFLLGLFNNSLNFFYGLILFINVGTGFSLLSKKELSRRLAQIIAGVMIGLTIIAVTSLVLTQISAHKKLSKTQNALSSLQNSQTYLTPQQQAQINSDNDIISKQQSILNKTYNIGYFEAVVIVLSDSALIYYLSRPEVEEQFS